MPDKRTISIISYSASLFLVGLAGRLLYCEETLRQLKFANLPIDLPIDLSYSIGYLTPDSHEYLALATNLLTGRFTEAISLTRPIGYPAFLALMGTKPAVILVAQAILLSFIPVCTFVLVNLLTRSILVGFLAGLVSCTSPTGLAIGSLVLSDGLFSALFAILFVALTYGALCGSWRWITFSAGLSGMATLVKPMLMFWPVISIFVYGLLVGLQPEPCFLGWLKKHLTPLLMLFLIPIVIMTSWCGINYVNNGLFTISNIGSRTMRTYIAIKAEEWAKAGGRPTGAAIRKNQAEVRGRLVTLSDDEKVEALRAESLAIFAKYPKAATLAFMDDIVENSTSGWNYFLEQLPHSHKQNGWLFIRVSRLEAIVRTVTLIIISLSPFLCLIAMTTTAPSPHNGRVFPALFAMALTLLYFVFLSGITFWTGPRIVYPSEMVQISIIATLLFLVRPLKHPPNRTSQLAMALKSPYQIPK